MTHVREMVSGDGQRWQFDAGTFALELLLSGGPGPYAVWEVLHTPDSLADWLRESRLAPLPELTISPEELARVRRFRDTLWPVTAAAAHGQSPDPAALAELNEFACPGPVPTLDPATMTRTWVGPVTGGQVLGAAVADTVALFSGGRTDRLRECGGDNCHLLFLDTSRPGTRRWCSMQRCGNRNKVRTHRSRSATAAAEQGE